MRLTARPTATADVSARQRDAMFALMERHYVNVRRDVFDAALARARYPDDYDAQAGVIRAGPWQYRLREGLADVTPERLRDAHVRFFHARNPGHERGDELCCLAPLTRGNFTPVAYKVIGPEP